MAKNKAIEVPKEIDFTDEPRGGAYNRLIDFAKMHCNKFSIVWREDLGHDRQKNEIAIKLNPFLLSDISTNKWPGTEIFSGTANVCTYKLDQETVEIIKSAKSLYQWKAPNFPEDIAFYTKSGEVWMGSVAHEHMGWLNTKAIEVADFKEIMKFLYGNGIINKEYYLV
jgi:hypothetical protein